jgi:hypothetical protein
MANESRTATPAARLRQYLVERARPGCRKHFNLWLVKSARMRQEWLLTGDAELVHFFLIEFDPEIKSFDLTPPPVIVKVGDDDIKTQFDACINFVDGRRECRELKFDRHSECERDKRQEEAQRIAASAMGAKYVREYGRELADTFPNRFWNGVRLLRFIRAAETHSLADIGNRIAISLSARPIQVLADLAEPFADHDKPLALAVIFQMLADRKVLIDLDARPVNQQTTVKATELL